MKVVMWQRIRQATDSYHSEGGVVVFAETEERARALANEQPGCQIGNAEMPDQVRIVEGGAEMVFIMPRDCE